MKFVDEFRDASTARIVLEEIHRVRLREPVTLMEVCGSHTMAVSRFGLRPLLPEGVRLVSGPGCPVCVTPAGSIDRAIAVSRQPGVIIATFGDLMRVPGSTSSLERERASGADVRVVYSTLDALALARRHRDRDVVFLGVGFETTAPTVAAAVLTADAEALTNFTVLCDHKVMPPPMRSLMQAPDVRVRGFLCPGHVSTIIGSEAYGFLATEFGASCVIAGFEPVDILQAVLLLLRQAAAGEARVENAYGRAVTPEGNPTARELMRRAFVPVDAEWRGFGVIPASGLAIAPSWRTHDAAHRFDVEVSPTHDDPACRCAQVLRGAALPPDCSLFGRRCTPADPLGACMVSSEGTCAAYYRYERPPSL